MTFLQKLETARGSRASVVGYVRYWRACNRHKPPHWLANDVSSQPYYQWQQGVTHTALQRTGPNIEEPSFVSRLVLGVTAGADAHLHDPGEIGSPTQNGASSGSPFSYGSASGTTTSSGGGKSSRTGSGPPVNSSSFQLAHGQLPEPSFLVPPP